MLLSDGTLTPLTPPATYGDSRPAWGGVEVYGNSGNLLLTNAFASYAAVYTAQPWIASLVNKLAYAVARLPLKTYSRAPDGSRAESRDAGMAKLLRKPNPRDDPFFFWLWTASTFEIYGEALWVKVRPAPGRPPTQLWPMHPANVTTHRNDDGDLVYRWVWGQQGGQFLEWLGADVVHFKSYNPANQVRGLSRLEPLRQTIVSEDAIRRSQASFWANGANPGVILTHPAEFRGPAAVRIAAQFRAANTGVDSWNKTVVLEEGMKAEAFQLDAESMQMIESRKVNREEACGIYDVPPPVVQILDRATFSNITEQMRSLYRDTMPPRLGLYESAIEAQLRPDFDPAGTTYAEFLLDEVLRGAFEQRAAANQAAIFSGQRTPNEVRRQDNLEPLEGGDRLYINAGAVPLDQADDGPAIQAVPQPNAPKPADVLDLDPCTGCGTHCTPSPRGLCRSCEGRLGGALQQRQIEERAS